MKMKVDALFDRRKIPELVPIDSPKIIKKIAECNEDGYRCMSKFGYSGFLLDQFQEPLPKGDKLLELLDDEFYRLTRESDYLSFLNKMFVDNGSKVLYSQGMDFSNIEICVDKLERLDKVDRYIILNIHKYYTRSETYSIDDNVLFEFFIKGFLREALYGIMYFEKLGIFLSYGYDMVLPIYFKSNDVCLSYRKKARKFGLYIRN